MKKRVGRPKTKVTDEEVAEIKRINKEKLDEIQSKGLDYIIELAKEHYGRNWMAVFSGENIFLHAEVRKEREQLRAEGKYKYSHGVYRKRPIEKLDKDTDEVLDTYANVEAIKNEYGWTDGQIASVIACCTGRYDAYKGFKWKFVTDDEE